MEFDKWQQELIDHEGNVTAACGRQTGKSTAAGRRRANQMIKYPCSISLMTAPSQRQSSELFIKTMGWLYDAHQKAIDAAGGYQDNPGISEKRNAELKRLFEAKHGIFNETPIKTMVVLKKDFSKPQGRDNKGSICYALPAGKTGTYLRTFALDFLDIDEGAGVPEPVYIALKPMLMISKKKRGLGWESFYGTPFGKGGFFYDSFTDDDFKQFHVSSEDCERFPKKELMKEKKRLPRLIYAQEYLGEFVDEFRQFFPTALIKSRMTFIGWDYKTQHNPGLKYFLGVDVARYGEDENSFIIAEMQNNGQKSLKIVKVETTERVSLVDTRNKILFLDKMFNFNRIFIDDAGLGSGLNDMLIEELGRKVVGLGNAKKTVDAEGQRNKIFKEDLYSNAAAMMEQDGKIEIINNLMLLKSLRSMTFQYTAEKNLRIFGQYSHLAEAFVRVCWAEKAKSLKLFCY